MKKLSLLLPLIIALSLFSCKDITQKLKKDLQKVDSLASIAVDSISQQIAPEQTNIQTAPAAEKQIMQQEQEFLKNLLIGTYANILNNIKRKDSLILKEFLYLSDSILLIRSQGIFQIVTIEPLQALFEYDYVRVPDSAWNCALIFGQLPRQTENGWSKNGCFAKEVKNFKHFSAIVDFARETNLPIDQHTIKYIREIEPKIRFQVINTYLGWSFYFIYSQDKFYLAAVDFNQY